MKYAAVQDMIDRFSERELIQLTDPDQQAVVPARAERALQDAEALADGYIGRTYALPLTGCAKPVGVNQFEYVVPPLLTRMVCDVARYYLYDDAAPEEVQRRFKLAQAELQAIADGKALLACPWGGDAGVSAATGPAAGETLCDFAPRQIGRDVDSGYR